MHAPTMSLIKVGQFFGHSYFRICRELYNISVKLITYFHSKEKFAKFKMATINAISMLSIVKKNYSAKLKLS